MNIPQAVFDNICMYYWTPDQRYYRPSLAPVLWYPKQPGWHWAKRDKHWHMIWIGEIYDSTRIQAYTEFIRVEEPQL